MVKQAAKYKYGFDHTTGDGQKRLMEMSRTGVDPGPTRVIDVFADGDTGHDPLGEIDGVLKWRMYPSGDIVERIEMQTRLRGTGYMTPAELLTNCTLDGILINHNMTWMPSARDDCPCMECQDHLDREEVLDRQAIWPHREDYTIQLVDQGFGDCLCGKPIEQFNDYDTKKKSSVVSAIRHILVQFYTTITLGGDSQPFKSVVRVRLHRWCVEKGRQQLDMEHQVRGILLVEGIPTKGKRRLHKLYEEDPHG